MLRTDDSPDQSSHQAAKDATTTWNLWLTLQWSIVLGIPFLLLLLLLEFLFTGGLSLDPVYLVTGVLGMNLLFECVRGVLGHVMMMLLLLLAVVLGEYLLNGTVTWGAFKLWFTILVVLLCTKFLPRADPGPSARTRGRNVRNAEHPSNEKSP
ncbi:MAG: hypothetical protein P8J45_13000 [Phycisphaerales bacterium]|nr:hypothetical protein [Phycisphaerales bacterium]